MGVCTAGLVWNVKETEPFRRGTLRHSISKTTNEIINRIPNQWGQSARVDSSPHRLWYYAVQVSPVCSCARCAGARLGLETRRGEHIPVYSIMQYEEYMYSRPHACMPYHRFYHARIRHVTIEVSQVGRNGLLELGENQNGLTTTYFDPCRYICLCCCA